MSTAFLLVAIAVVPPIEPPTKPPEESRASLIVNVIGYVWAMVPAVNAKGLEKAYQELGHDDFRRREKAERTLDDAGIGAAPYYLRGMQSDDVEVRRRCTTGMDRLRRLKLPDFQRGQPSSKALDFTRKRWPIVPCCDAPWYSRPEGYQPRRTWWTQVAWETLWPYYEAAGRQHVGEGLNWKQYRGGTRLALADAIDLGVPVWVLDLVVMEMFRRDDMFLSQPCFAREYWPRLRYSASWPMIDAEDVMQGAPEPIPRPGEIH